MSGRRRMSFKKVSSVSEFHGRGDPFCGGEERREERGDGHKSDCLFIGRLIHTAHLPHCAEGCLANNTLQRRKGQKDEADQMNKRERERETVSPGRREGEDAIHLCPREWLREAFNESLLNNRCDCTSSLNLTRSLLLLSLSPTKCITHCH